jgi:hypothetical protein
MKDNEASNQYHNYRISLKNQINFGEMSLQQREKASAEEGQ